MQLSFKSKNNMPSAKTQKHEIKRRDKRSRTSMSRDAPHYAGMYLWPVNANTEFIFVLTSKLHKIGGCCTALLINML